MTIRCWGGVVGVGISLGHEFEDNGALVGGRPIGGAAAGQWHGVLLLLATVLCEGFRQDLGLVVREDVVHARVVCCAGGVVGHEREEGLEEGWRRRRLQFVFVMGLLVNLGLLCLLPLDVGGELIAGFEGTWGRGGPLESGIWIGHDCMNLDRTELGLDGRMVTCCVAMRTRDVCWKRAARVGMLGPQSND